MEDFLEAGTLLCIDDIDKLEIAGEIGAAGSGQAFEIKVTKCRDRATCKDADEIDQMID